MAVPNPREVESIHWFTPREMAGLSELLDSNREFLELVERGEIRLTDSQFTAGPQAERMPRP